MDSNEIFIPVVKFFVTLGETLFVCYAMKKLVNLVYTDIKKNMKGVK